MKKRSWGMFTANALWAVSCAWMVFENVVAKSWWALVYMIALCFAAYETYRALWPRCRHEHRVLIGLCGDEMPVAIRFEPDPEEPNSILMRKTMIQSGKYRCLDCGNVWLVKPTAKDIATLRAELEGRTP